ncbi:MAG: helix-turn-helix domain-containing protein [Spirochaetota bacterium]|jgi:transcriptional regulator with XRE-family HTH domain|nr:helix-turn-helix domain-containing protein [Spirochaetota bacterium]
MTNLRELLAANIKTFRKESGLTQSKLAEKVGATTRYIAKIEGGENYPSPEMIERIAFALNKDALDMFNIFSPQEDWKERVLSKLENVLQQELCALKNKPHRPKGKI